jgi:diguanylate cyclase (GGDEF)-like protein
MSEVASGVDLLTGAYQRSRFEELMVRLIAEARRARTPLALIHVDVDDLQEHNDVHGRDSLDAALSWLASKISLILDGKGPIGRVGGDEFAVALPGVPLEQARRLAERLRRTMPRTLHASAFGDYRLTVSVGVVTLRPGEPVGNLLDAAEEACLRAKQSGRDTVVSR